MGKSCCAVGCANCHFKGYGLKFCRFPTDPEREMRWVAAINQKIGLPTNTAGCVALTLFEDSRATIQCVQTMYLQYSTTLRLLKRKEPSDLCGNMKLERTLKGSAMRHKEGRR